MVCEFGQIGTQRETEPTNTRESYERWKVMRWNPPDAMPSWLKENEGIRSIGIHVVINMLCHTEQANRIIYAK